MERELIKDQLTKCHIDEYMSEDDGKIKQTEVQANYTKLCVRPVKRKFVPSFLPLITFFINKLNTIFLRNFIFSIFYFSY